MEKGKKKWKRKGKERVRRKENPNFEVYFTKKNTVTINGVQSSSHLNQQKNFCWLPQALDQASEEHPKELQHARNKGPIEGNWKATELHLVE